jgi:GxxExxY protein
MGKLIYEDLTYKIIGILFKVHTALGCGFPEKVYQRAIELELEKEKIPFQREQTFSVKYEDKDIGSFRLDLIIDKKLIIELKAVERLPKVFREQLISQLKASPYQVGLLANFGTPKLEYIRITRIKS